jgi:hypothetical protein
MPTGPGVTTNGFNMVGTVAFVITVTAAIVILAAIVVVRQPGRRLLVFLVAVGVLQCGSLLSRVAPEYGPVVGGVAGMQWESDSVTARDVAVVTAPPGDLYTLTISVENDAMLPIRVLGLVVPAEAPRTFPAWHSLVLSANAMPPLPGVVEGGAPNSVEVPPGGILVLNATGQATGCAAGPAGSTLSLSTSEIEIAYSVVGLVSTTTLRLPRELVEPQQENCGVV